mmetsp:Transcript_24658/g.57913  ORF Transcript_24658/g.57913 Transcript_24658/m.57913 type:complete len:108 (-) Transcript_24658:535-858(-)
MCVGFPREFFSFPLIQRKSSLTKNSEAPRLDASNPGERDWGCVVNSHGYKSLNHRLSIPPIKFPRPLVRPVCSGTFVFMEPQRTRAPNPCHFRREHDTVIVSIIVVS